MRCRSHGRIHFDGRLGEPKAVNACRLNGPNGFHHRVGRYIGIATDNRLIKVGSLDVPLERLQAVRTISNGDQIGAARSTVMTLLLSSEAHANQRASVAIRSIMAPIVRRGRSENVLTSGMGVPMTNRLRRRRQDSKNYEVTPASCQKTRGAEPTAL